MNELKLSPVFEKIARAYKKYRYIINQGGTSSTKTFSTLQFLLVLALKHTLEIDIVGLTQGHLKSGVLLDMPKVMAQFGLNFYNLYSKTNKSLEFFHGSNMNFISVDTIGKAHGGRRDILYLNEANHLNYKIAEQLIIRTRDKVFIDFNPTSRFWVHNEILENEKTRAHLIKSTYKDNPFLEKEIVSALESRMKDENFWRVYGLGEVGILEGRVFNNTEVLEFNKNAFSRYYNGIDWGFSTDPFAFIRCAVENDHLYITDEIYSTNLLNKDSIPLVKSILGYEYVVCDSAEPKSISEYQSGGVNAIAARKGRGSIESGIKFLQSFSKIYIHPTCKNAQKELFNYCFKKNLNGEILPIPEDINNHLIDALRYALEDLTGKDTISVIKGLRL